jgi:NAD-dependent SIR2 family protein deacetylase
MADDKKHQVREINEQAFIEEVYESHKDDGDVKFVFFIGAGCSSSSDIPTVYWKGKNALKNLKIILIRR